MFGSMRIGRVGGGMWFEMILAAVLLQAYTINKYDMHKYAYLLIVLRSYP